VIKPVLLIRSSNNEVDEAALTNLGIPSLIDPYIEINVADDPNEGERLLSLLEGSDDQMWLLATSVNAMKFWARIVGEDRLRAAIAARSDVRFAAVGQTTADALRNFGASDVLIPSEATAKSLAEAMVGTSSTGHALVPGGNLAMKSLPSTLISAGWQVSTAVVYTTSPVEKEPKSAHLIREGEIGAILFRSPSAVRALTHFLPNPAVPLICAGTTTAQALVDQGLVVAAISPKPSAQVVASTIYSLLC
jgi:uroporphyrinogen-III synthase